MGNQTTNIEKIKSVTTASRSMNKISKIKHMPNGKWRVTDKSGEKNLGESDTKEEAIKRLKQVEYFKHQLPPPAVGGLSSNTQGKS